MDIVDLKPVRSIIEILFARGRKVAPGVASGRFQVCLECEHFIESGNRCRKCGCYMAIKTEWSGSRCPEGRWEI